MLILEVAAAVLLTLASVLVIYGQTSARAALFAANGTPALLVRQHVSVRLLRHASSQDEMRDAGARRA